MDQLVAFIGADIFDGTRVVCDHALLVQGGVVRGVVARADVPGEARIGRRDGGTLVPGFVDLQVNGGGGVMFNDAPSLATLKVIARAHGRLGATSILPTLITDTPDKTRAAIAAVEAAIAQGIPGITGLHLEGPHLSQARKGAHDGDLIRPMTGTDVTVLLGAAASLPVLKVTIAPESVTFEQMQRLSGAGIILSLGHTDAGHATCVTAFENGVRCATHLFNAMSPLGNREPGLVGAVLGTGGVSAGMIADKVHVHPEAMGAALRAKRGPGRVFLVSDAMATAGSGIDSFVLNGRRIGREDGRLTLADGTLAGADLALTTAIGNLVRACDLPLQTALAMATSIPAGVIGLGRMLGHIGAGRAADFVHLGDDLDLRGVWRKGKRLVDS
ncbi:MAG: N-acetylglucosamine-6-phosphate deacetylase [Rhodobacteraceae bacterium]|nr:MAG: N-acetylglucosamine-6-phosphate deacetylase [Paracoccaceae bacterium]